jgi:excisionase family DNA binding protein
VSRIRSLKDHPSPYLTTSELAEYWLVSRKQIYKQIDAGTLKAIRLGPRLMRVSKTDALEFERIAKMDPSAMSSAAKPQLAAHSGHATHSGHFEQQRAHDHSSSPHKETDKRSRHR